MAKEFKLAIQTDIAKALRKAPFSPERATSFAGGADFVVVPAMIAAKAHDKVLIFSGDGFARGDRKSSEDLAGRAEQAYPSVQIWRNLV